MLHIDFVSESYSKKKIHLNGQPMILRTVKQTFFPVTLHFTNHVQAPLAGKRKPRKNSKMTPQVQIQDRNVCLDVDLISKPFVSWHKITKSFVFHRLHGMRNQISAESLTHGKHINEPNESSSKKQTESKMFKLWLHPIVCDPFLQDTEWALILNRQGEKVIG